jgi:hypothetical protein
MVSEICGFNTLDTTSNVVFEPDWITLPGPAWVWQGLSEKEWDEVGYILDLCEQHTRHMSFDIRTWLECTPKTSLLYNGVRRYPVGFDFPHAIGNVLSGAGFAEVIN